MNVASYKFLAIYSLDDGIALLNEVVDDVLDVMPPDANDPSWVFQLKDGSSMKICAGVAVLYERVEHQDEVEIPEKDA